MKNLKIKNKKPIQENFLGFNAVYHGYAGLSDSAGRVYSEELCELEADRAAALGIKIARTYYKWYSYDFERGCWDWENSKDYNAFCRWVERLKVRGIDVALNTGWCSPGDILSNHWGGKSPFTVEGDWNASVANYAKWVSDTVHDMVEVRGLTNVKYLVMFTEPQYGSGTRPENMSTYDCWYEATKAAVVQLEKDGRRHLVKIIGPNEGSTIDPKMVRWLKEKDPDLVDIYTAHNYLDYKVQKDINNGNFIAAGGTRGMRIQQKVNLKSFTEYELSVTLSASMEDPLNASGYMIFGAFKPYNANGLFASGGQPTTRLNRTSTKMVQASELYENLTEYTHTFKTDEDVKDIVVGAFFDIIGQEHDIQITRFSLKEVNIDVELLKNLDFKTSKDWQFTALSLASSSTYNSFLRWINGYFSNLDEGDEFWFDEYNTSNRSSTLANYEHPRHGTDIGAIRTALLNSGIQSSLMWTLFDQQWPNNHTEAPIHQYFDGDHRFGVMPVLTRTLVPYPAYYATQITGYVDGDVGTKAYEGVGVGDVTLSMTKSPDGNVTVLVVNDTAESTEITIDFEESIGKKLYRYLYDPATVLPDENATPIPTDKTFENVEATLTDTLPPYSVVAYTSKLR